MKKVKVQPMRPLIDFGKAADQASVALAKMPTAIHEFNQAWQSTQAARMAHLGLVAPGLVKAAADAERNEAYREHREWLEQENLKCYFESFGTSYIERARKWERQCLEVYFAINGNYPKAASLFTLFVFFIAVLGVL